LRNKDAGRPADEVDTVSNGLKKEVATLREENERLTMRMKARVICKSLGYNMKYLLSIVVISTLLGCTSVEKDNAIKVQTLVQSTSSWDGSQLPNYPAGQAQITILKITIPPQTELPLHKHPVINAGVLLQGNLTVVAEANDVLHLKAGDPIVELVN
jgi:hypothetical protein